MRGSWKAVAVGGMALLCVGVGVARAAEGRADGGKDKAHAPAAVPKGWTSQKRKVKVASADGVNEKEITYYKNSIGMEFVLVPAGEFMMGSPEDEPARHAGEGPQHKVGITKPFYMGATEVAQEHYDKVMGENGSHFKDPKNPVEMVRWLEATEFCSRLSARERGVTYRLPTEAEWEYACRAGSTTPFYSGQTISTELANYNGSYTYGHGRKGVYRQKTMPGGGLPANPWGLYDMHGNLWEWCQDYYRDYLGDDPPGAAIDAYHVMRGGCWRRGPRFCRSAYRWAVSSRLRYDGWGFRVVVSAPTAGEEAVAAGQTPAGEPGLRAPVERPGRADQKREQTQTSAPVTRAWTSEKRRVKVATPKGIEEKEITYYKNALGMEFVLIQAGEFIMGSPAHVARRTEREGPQHPVRITKAFYMGATEVTQEHYQNVMGENRSHFKDPKNPVETVCWVDAREFCSRLSARERGVTYRLPTEAEWEYACRAGTTMPFYTGETISTDLVNYNGDYVYGNGWQGENRQKTTPGGSLPANPWGLYDMHGNLWEWCQDLYGQHYYRTSPREDPPGPAIEERRVIRRPDRFRVMRGGCWRQGPRFCRSAYRWAVSPTFRYNGWGFRVVVSAQTAEEEPVAAGQTPAGELVSRVPVGRPGRADQKREQTQTPARVTKAWPSEKRKVKVATPEGVKAKEITCHRNTLGMEFVLVPAGEFMMGSPAGEDKRDEDEGPQHKVRITRPFYMAATEVTQEQYQNVMGKAPFRFKDPGNPVETVSWHDAVEFCRTLSDREPGVAYRLPTEAEWEYACRAGTTTPFYTGETVSTDLANYNGNYAYGNGREGVHRGKTTPVGSLPANPWGLYDMHGNVWEWCQDRYDGRYYRNAPREDPPGPRTGDSYVLRGGSWGSVPYFCRSAARARNVAVLTSNYVGFRVVVSAR